MRTEVCNEFDITYQTNIIVNGVTSVTGEAYLHVYNDSYTSVDYPTWIHQVSISATTASWGDAVKATINGSAWINSGACSLSSENFPPQPLTPLGTLRSGEAFFNTTATADGAIGYCSTKWIVQFTNPSYSNALRSPSPSPTRMAES